MRPVVLSCLVVVCGHIHLVTAGPFPSRHPVDLLRAQCASKTCGCQEGDAGGLEEGLCRDSIQSHSTTCGEYGVTEHPHGVRIQAPCNNLTHNSSISTAEGTKLVTKQPDRGHNY